MIIEEENPACSDNGDGSGSGSEYGGGSGDGDGSQEAMVDCMKYKTDGAPRFNDIFKFSQSKVYYFSQ